VSGCQCGQTGSVQLFVTLQARRSGFTGSATDKPEKAVCMFVQVLSVGVWDVTSTGLAVLALMLNTEQRRTNLKEIAKVLPV
jgi:chorismate synthase